MVKLIPSFYFVDPNEAICVEQSCDLLIDNVLPVYQDGLHYSWAGSVKVLSYLLVKMGLPQGKLRLRFEDIQSLDRISPHIILESTPKTSVEFLDQSRLDNTEQTIVPLDNDDIPSSSVSPTHSTFLNNK